MCTCCRTLAVESIRLDRGAGPREHLRVTRTVNGQRYLLGYCRDVDEVAAHIDLAQLIDADVPGTTRT